MLGSKGSEVAIVLIFRLCVGLLLSLIFGFLCAVIGWLSFRQTALVASFIWLVVLSVGVGSGIGAMLAWWKSTPSMRVTIAYIAFVLIAAMASAAISFQVFGGGGYFVWFPEVGSIRILHMGQNVRPVLVGAVVGGNVGGALAWLLRETRLGD